MFSKKPEAEPPKLQDVMFPLKTTLQETSDPKPQNNDDWTESEGQKPEIVTIVEKISGILSPYFIVIVGLFLYENNVLIGTTLIVVGILSLLKISLKDITKAFESLKNFINSKSNP
jgi:hypothetical protein